MCGVAAAVGPRAYVQVPRMVQAMSHRGIRQAYLETSDRSAVGHVRLPIVGTGEENDQPHVRGDTTLAFVGELLDFREHLPWASCDLELAVRTWCTQGPAGFRDFDGFWSVVAYDYRSKRIRCLVDYLGQKPLYVRDDACARAVASEPDALATLGPLPLDQVYLSSVGKWGYCPETWRTPYVGVRKMQPGELATLPEEGPVEYEAVDPLLPLPSTPEQLRGEVEAAVRRRVLSSDVPVACLVSGGLDSAVTYVLASRHGNVRPYHVENGEGNEAREVAPSLGPEDLLPLGGASIERCLRYMQEPLDLGSLEPQVALSDAIASAGAERVCLTGDGADELFGGYGRSRRYDSQASDVWHELVAWHLPRLDRVMMRNRVEVRSPFLARRVAGIALALPRAARTDKQALRSLFRDDLPPGVADRPKRALRTAGVEKDREGRSRELVDLFVEQHRRREVAKW